MRPCKNATLGDSDLCPISASPCPGTCIYADIMQNCFTGIVVLDIANQNIIFRNDSSFCFLNVPEAPQNYDGFLGLLPDLDSFLTILPNMHQGELHLGPNTVGYTVYHVSKNYLLIFLRDITERIRLESIAEAVNNMNNIGYIFSGIRHEIGNPINSIKMTLTVLKRNIDDYSKETVVEYIDRTLGEIGRIEYLMKSLKNFNMYETPYLQNVHLHSFLEKFLDLVKNDFKNNGITITTEIDPEAQYVSADPRALQQILLNIMTTAADALQENEDPQVHIKATPLHNLVSIDVIDNGCGMEEEELANLFRPFVTNKPGGTGLGLVIVKKMLAKMGGFIDVESRPGSGTKVMLILEGKPHDAGRPDAAAADH